MMRRYTSAAPPGYELVRPVGHGASSIVWQAMQQSTGRPVALKMLDTDISEPDSHRRFVRERDVMATLAAHPGILTIHDAGIHENTPWLATEFCRRGSLGAYVAATGPLPLPAALGVLVRMAEALAVAHEHGVLHCDVKPANIMLTDHGEPALGDFGIARVTVGRATTTTVGGFSLDHVAPELLDEEKSSTRSDVYSLGTTMWELLASRPPFRRSGDISVATVIKRIMSQPLPDLPDVPTPVLDLLREMSAKDPADRIASMREVAEHARALGQNLGLPLGSDLGLAPHDVPEPLSSRDETVHRRRPVPGPAAQVPPPPSVRRKRGMLVAGSAAALVLVIGGAVAVTARGQSDTITPQADVQAPTTAPTSLPTSLMPPPSSTPALPSSTATVPQAVAPTAAAQAKPAPVPRYSDAPHDAAPAADDKQDAQSAEPAARPQPVSRADGSTCFATAVRGGLVLGADRQHNAGGPNFTSAACNAIHIKLTSAVYRTYARSCLETANGSSITSCSGWILLSYPNTWDTLSTGVPGGTRWQIQMYAEGPEKTSFLYTA